MFTQKITLVNNVQVNVLEPHPFAPILATSGLEHAVKVWSPCEPHVLLDAATLRRHMKRSPPHPEHTEHQDHKTHTADTDRRHSSSSGDSSDSEHPAGGGGVPWRVRADRSQTKKTPPAPSIPVNLTGAELDAREQSVAAARSTAAVVALRRELRRNRRERRRGEKQEDVLDGDFLYMLMRSLRRGAERVCASTLHCTSSLVHISYFK